MNNGTGIVKTENVIEDKKNTEETPEERHLRHKLEYEKRSRRKKRIAVIISFLMSLIILAVSSMAAVYYGMYSNESVERAFSTSDYVDSAFECAYDKIESLTIKSGLPVEIIESVVNKEQISMHTIFYMKSISSSSSGNMSTDVIRETIKSNAESYMQSQNIKIDDAIESNINAYASKCEEIYKNCICVNQLDFCKSVKTYIAVAMIVIIPVSVAAFVLLSLLLARNTRRNHQMLRYYSWSFGAAGFTLFVPSLVFTAGKFYSKVEGISYEYKYLLISDYLRSVAGNVLYLSILLIAVQIILLAVWAYIVLGKKRKKKK